MIGIQQPRATGDDPMAQSMSSTHGMIDVMSRKARTVEEDLIEAVREDDLASILAEVRERSEIQDELEQPE